MSRLIIFLWLVLLLPIRAEAQADTTLLKQLEKEMYRLYAKQDADSLMMVTEQLKEAALKAKDEQLFYKAWCNQAIYLGSHNNRQKGLETVRAVRHYAEAHDSKYGLYCSTHVNATILSAQRFWDQAEIMFKKAIDYQKRYFPDQSAAVSYLGLAKIYYNEKKYDKALEISRKALQEPNIIPPHQINAMSYICLSEKNLTGKEGFMRVYQERKKLVEKYKNRDNLDKFVELYHAELNGDYAKRLEIAESMHDGLDKMEMMATSYALLGDYKNAYEMVRKHKKFSDSVNNGEILRQAQESALQLEVTRAESEAKDLRFEKQILLTWGILAVALLSLTFLGLYLYRRRKQLEHLRSAYDQLEDTTTQKERIESELRIARDIQMSMVPRVFPAFPDRKDIDLYALMVPAKEVGGDLYDFFLQNETLYFCIGDVSGKGVPASMTMAVAVNLFRSIAKEGFKPAYIANKINDTLLSTNENGLFVTMFIGEIDLTTGRMEFCNAGHNPPIIGAPMTRGSARFAYHFMDVEPNAPIGLWPNLEYVGEHIDNVKGQTLFIYTDGVNEAENRAQKQFGEERMLRILDHTQQPFGERLPKSHSHFIVDEMKHAVEAHVGDAEPSDDLTMLCIFIK